ncbi:MAG: hypothetical protein IPM96_12690 [Ignavibacteria bacterium]|nr:hypothetical protein [Ignavibacteria bacterium]
MGEAISGSNTVLEFYNNSSAVRAEIASSGKRGLAKKLLRVKRSILRALLRAKRNILRALLRAKRSNLRI